MATPWSLSRPTTLSSSVDLAWLERRGRLVHDDDAGVGGDRPRHGDHLLDAEAELAERTLDVGHDAVPREDLFRLAVHPAQVDRAEAVRLAAEEHVAGHRELRREVHLLVDRLDAGQLRRREASGSAPPVLGSAPPPRRAGTRPVMSLISVDLPAPFSPTRACTSPGHRSIETSFSAVTPAKRLLAPRTETVGVARLLVHAVTERCLLSPCLLRAVVLRVVPSTRCRC